ncbi:unnamed protein product [Oppiella nova]|uniref:Glutathione S-transferase n=1 Tax=Oppiella nova TaxID=334625 RepID=A0A7R9M4S6_9ACAR|nr:unnamed protein product [Oppiella nova]CAG2170515.1 unnamed protein product [Oppiella nova]
MPIDIYSLRYSPPCRAVLMTAKHLNIDLNIKTVDLSQSQHLAEDYLKINPAHTVPTIDDDGFILWESRAIMQYLCNRYAPDSPLYPSDPKKRALVDRWLNYDLSIFSALRESLLVPKFMGLEMSEENKTKFNDTIKLLDQLIGNNKYVAGSNLTIADLSVLATTNSLIIFDMDLSPYPNFKTWMTGLTEELPYFDEINKFENEDIMGYMAKMKAFFLARRSESWGSGPRDR